MTQASADAFNEAGWWKPVIQLLQHLNTLKEDKPATMIIRHSHRVNINNAEELRSAALTDLGREASRNFGSNLPNARRVILHHSPASRCRETAEYIGVGAEEKGIRVAFARKPVMLHPPKHDAAVDVKIAAADTYAIWQSFINDWISGRFPEYEIEGSLRYSKRIARRLIKEIKSAEYNDLYVCVTHDLIIHALLFHWFGLTASVEDVGYLNGFVFQLDADRMLTFLNGSLKEINTPYWWLK